MVLGRKRRKRKGLLSIPIIPTIMVIMVVAIHRGNNWRRFVLIMVSKAESGRVFLG